MNTKFIKSLGLLGMLVVAMFFTSCQKEDGVTDVENFVLQSTNGIEDGCAAGMAGCYELVFPVTIQFSDSTTVEVASFEAMRLAIRNWFVANGGHPKPFNRPTIVLPIEVINQAGEVITVETLEELKELRELCGPHHGGPGGPHGGGGPCFTLVFPITFSFADSTQVTVNSPQELRAAAHAWNQNNPGQHARPQFVFPITVTLRDGTQVVVNNREELRALKEDCRG